ncbi:uncharacterized protein LOC100890147 isoform X1 [Strongylocentrotus purpuratus]|uniref:tRNA-splicing endonuclease subunit Sen54 N-terminal domain-containing protein n=1 Tax=Strongylocentrotus purpuratus TaxID=7668 RepID=A0A7M7SYI1_STRPU|nr:uncharacterized protein LOC100890147 isoform X1 [Strongylocentrotus purpuratus]
MASEFIFGAAAGGGPIKAFVLSAKDLVEHNHNQTVIPYRDLFTWLSTLFDSAKDLVEHNHSQTVIPYRGPKEGHPDGSKKQDQQVERKREQRHELLRIQRVSRLGTLSVGEWEPDKELVVVKNHKGKFWRTMGYMLQGQKYLYPEEGLFLLEVGSMELQYGGTPLSVQRAYNLMIPTYIDKEHYRVYCNLMRLGYITTRHIESDVTDYEYRLRMHQYRHTQNLAYHKVQGWFQQLGNDEPMNSIWPDSDSNSESLSSTSSHQNWYKRNRMSAGYSNANTNSSYGREQSGCDSSEVGSAGEMSRAIKARQRSHRSPGKSNKQANMKNYKTCQKEEDKSGMNSDNVERRKDAGEGERCSKPTKMTDDEACTGTSRDCKQSEGHDGESPIKTCEFVEPMEPIDSTKPSKDTSDESSVYSDGPVYPDDDTGKGSGFEDMSISLLDFHKRRLTASSEDSSKKRKKMEMSGTESDSSRGGKAKFNFSSHLNVCPPLPPHSGRKACTLDDSGKDTPSDLDQESAKHDQNYRSSRKRVKQGLKEGKHHDRSVSSDLGLSDTASDTSVDLEEFLDMVVPMMQGEPEGPEINDIQAYLEYSHWNFDKITLPDIASSIKPAHLPFPSKELVPASIAAGRCIDNVATVKEKQLELTKLCNNNKKILAKSKKIIDVLEIIGDRKEKNQDSKTPSSDTTKEPDNWKEYKEKKQQEEQNLSDLMTSPVSHLWSGAVKPLLKPSDAKSTGHVLNKLQVIQGANLTCEHSGQRFSAPIVDSKIAFDVFLPDKKYKKTNPGQPNFCVVVCSEEDPVPELAAQLDLLMKAAPVPLVWGVVDNADINFYTLNDIELPVDITIG